MHVLLIDDDDQYRQQCRSLLLEQGFHISDFRTAADAAEPIRHLPTPAVGLVFLGIGERSQLSEHYLLAVRALDESFERQGLPRPPLFMLAASLEPKTVALAARLEAAILRRSDKTTLSSTAGVFGRHVRSYTWPAFFGVHTCDSECTPGEEVSEIGCGDSPESACAVPFSRVVRIYFDFIAQNVNPLRPKTADFIVREMLERPFYRRLLEGHNVNRRTFIQNLYRIGIGLEQMHSDGNLLVPADQIAVSRNYAGGETVYSLRCRYSVIHGSTARIFPTPY